MEFEDILYESQRRRLDHDQPARQDERVSRPDLRRADQGAEPRRLRPSSAPSCWPAPATAPSAPAATSRAHNGNYDGRGTIGLPMEELHAAIRDVPKPVIARVQGFAIGGGNVLCTICDLTIAPRRPVRPGRPEGGLGRSGLRHRLPGARRRREEGARDLVPLPPLQRRRSGRDGPGQRGGAARPARRRSRALVRRDHGAQPDRAGHRQAQLQRRHRDTAASAAWGCRRSSMYYDTEESKEGVRAFNEKRKPNSASSREFAGDVSRLTAFHRGDGERPNPRSPDRPAR